MFIVFIFFPIIKLEGIFSVVFFKETNPTKWTLGDKTAFFTQRETDTLLYNNYIPPFVFLSRPSFPLFTHNPLLLSSRLGFISNSLSANVKFISYKAPFMTLSPYHIASMWELFHIRLISWMDLYDSSKIFFYFWLFKFFMSLECFLCPRKNLPTYIKKQTFWKCSSIVHLGEPLQFLWRISSK